MIFSGAGKYSLYGTRRSISSMSVAMFLDFTTIEKASAYEICINVDCTRFSTSSSVIRVIPYNIVDKGSPWMNPKNPG